MKKQNIELQSTLTIIKLIELGHDKHLHIN